MSPEDADKLGVESGGQVRIVTATGSAQTCVEVNARMQAGHVSLPNGFGLDNVDLQNSGEGVGVRMGVAANELTCAADRDLIAGTPWHKHVPARVELIV